MIPSRRAGSEEPRRPRYPSYADLPAVDGHPDFHCGWSVWGSDDSLGSLNHITPETRLAALNIPHSGVTVPLSLSASEPYPGVSATRMRYEHTVLRSRNGQDDKLDNFFPQYSSHWDGLRHVRFREFGYWGGRQDVDLEQGQLGVQSLATHGIIARGVLLDVASYLSAAGKEPAWNERFAISPELLNVVAAAQGVDVNPGDILLVRTGWLGGYQALAAAGREPLVATISAGLACPGLAGTADIAAYLWDRRVAAVAADNPAVEALPVVPEQGFLHRRLIPLLGLLLGELWDLDPLATKCREQGRYQFLLVSSPLTLPGSAGSPSNAYAIL